MENDYLAAQALRRFKEAQRRLQRAVDEGLVTPEEFQEVTGVAPAPSDPTLIPEPGPEPE